MKSAHTKAQHQFEYQFIFGSKTKVPRLWKKAATVVAFIQNSGRKEADDIVH